MSVHEFCDQCGRNRGLQYFTADCMIHRLCNTCTAVFLDGNSAHPNCSKCKAARIMAAFQKKRPMNKSKSLGIGLKMKMTNYTDNDYKPQIEQLIPINKGPDPNSETLTPTSPLMERNELLEELRDLDSIEESCKERKSDVLPSATTSATPCPVVSDRGSVSFRFDPITGKAIRFFPYIPKVVKKTKEVSDQFKSVITDDDYSEPIPEGKIPTNHNKIGCSSDLAYIDNLFAFLREEKSKHQSMKIPGITFKLHKEEKEFQVKEYATYKNPSYSFNQSTSPVQSKQSPVNPPVVADLLTQIKTYENYDDPESETEREDVTENDDIPGGRRLNNLDEYGYSTLTLRTSTSPASDVKGEYGSEDDKQSISSNSGSGSLEQHSYNSDNSRSIRSDGIKCPLPVYENAFDASENVIDDELLPEFWEAGYNADAEEERGTSPCKAKHRTHCSSGWLLDPSALPEPPHKSGNDEGTGSSEEESSLEPEVLDALSSTTTGLLYLDDEIAEEFWEK